MDRFQYCFVADLSIANTLVPEAPEYSIAEAFTRNVGRCEQLGMLPIYLVYAATMNQDFSADARHALGITKGDERYVLGFDKFDPVLDAEMKAKRSEFSRDYFARVEAKLAASPQIIGEVNLGVLADEKHIKMGLD